MIPIEVAHLESPQKYYTVLRNDLIRQGRTQAEIENLLKVSYITELEEAVNRNDYVFRRKSSLYYRALIYVLASAIPYLCLAFNFSVKDVDPQKVQTLNMEKKYNFNQDKNMPQDNNSTNDNSSTRGDNAANNSSNNSLNTSTTSSTTQTTRYPGVPDSEIIQSHPRLIKENKENPSKK